ncbi:sensor histidine kinase [Corynebacterium urogenitale]
MSKIYPQASTGTWWRDSNLWVQLVIQVVLFTLLGLSVGSNYAQLVRDTWIDSLFLPGLGIAFVGLLVQRWKITLGLLCTAVGLVLMGASAKYVYVLGYLIVCYEAWYIVAFTRRYTKVWMGALFAGSFATLGWAMWLERVYGVTKTEWREFLSVLTIVGMLVVVSISLAGLIGRQTARQNERIETLAARAELATVSERNRIAREMHDIVAHSLTVVIAQADGGRYAGKKDTDKAIEALDTIAERGRDALAQMRSLLSVLHDGSVDERDVSVAPGVEGIPDLVYDAKRNGLTVNYKVLGEPRSLDEVRDLTVYRVVQESLTNVMKHAGAVEVSLSIEWEKDAVRISVDNRPGEERVEGSGQGLTGIAERVRVHGGSASWGPSLIYAGGWNVTATLPLGK